MENPIFVCSLPRSGGTLLTSLLYSVGKIGRLRESLHKFRQSFGVDSDDEVLLSYFKEISESHLNGYWGLKIHLADLPVVERYLKLKQIRVQDVSWIWLRRRNKIKQTISQIIAENLDIWHIEVNDVNKSDSIDRLKEWEGNVSLDQLAKRVLRYYLSDSGWEFFFLRHEVYPYVVFYEDFLDSSRWDSLVSGILDHLKIGYTEPLNVHTRLIKTANFVDNYGALYEKFLGRHPLMKRYFDAYDSDNSVCG